MQGHSPLSVSLSLYASALLNFFDGSMFYEVVQKTHLAFRMFSPLILFLQLQASHVEKACCWIAYQN